MKRTATFGNVSLKSGDKVSVETKYGTKGEGTIIGFRDVLANTNILVRMNEGTTFDVLDKWPYKKGMYDRIADIGVSFKEIGLVESKKSRKPRKKVAAEAVAETKIEEKAPAKKKAPAAKKTKSKSKPKTNGAAAVEATVEDVQPPETIEIPTAEHIEVEQVAVAA